MQGSLQKRVKVLFACHCPVLPSQAFHRHGNYTHKHRGACYWETGRQVSSSKGGGQDGRKVTGEGEVKVQQPCHPCKALQQATAAHAYMLETPHSLALSHSKPVCTVQVARCEEKENSHDNPSIQLSLSLSVPSKIPHRKRRPCSSCPCLSLPLPVCVACRE